MQKLSGEAAVAGPCLMIANIVCSQSHKPAHEKIFDSEKYLIMTSGEELPIDDALLLLLRDNMMTSSLQLASSGKTL